MRRLLKHFEVAPNAYYNYLKNKKEGYQMEKQRIFEEIKSIFYDNKRLLGHRGMKVFLARKGIHLSKTTVHKYMNRELKLYAVTMRKKRIYPDGEKNKGNTV